MNTPSHNVTELLLAWQGGDAEALNKLIPLVHHELHRIAARHMRKERRGHTLQTTALLNEAYEKLVDHKGMQWENRAHFFAIAAQIMRRILINHARKRLRIKRGGTRQKVSLDDIALVSEPRAAELISLDAALNELASFDPQKSRIVEMKFFGGLSMEEIAEIEQVSIRTIERQWRTAKAWLYDAIK
ncbi:MAG: RNA polymerase subunit sigma-70 [Acidobacteria bacterium]|nr:MAG: RNA polymerase subunit sigma-70 [Acidobacteriota bacterium]